jgi:hypothetical protein
MNPNAVGFLSAWFYIAGALWFTVELILMLVGGAR